MESKFSKFLKTAGPGILFASTCIGVSHLVQSTRAGADYGYALLGAVLIANFFKYPFFEFVSRYTVATGQTILDGYYQRSKWVLVTYIVMTLATMFIVTAAVVIVTAGLVMNLIPVTGDTIIFSIPTTSAGWSLLIFLGCFVLLASGKYNVLDGLIKIISIILVLSVIIAFFSSLTNTPPPQAANFVVPDLWSNSSILFAIALMGWMPTAVDLGTWGSLWTRERIKQTGYYPTLKETLLDFKIGYFVSAFLAICFLTLGARTIYGTDIELENSSPKFAGQVVGLFTGALGDWSFYIIAIAAFSTMFSTSVTVLDGYGRALERSFSLLFFKGDENNKRLRYLIIMVVLVIGSYYVISSFSGPKFKLLIDFATTLSFGVAPIAAGLNFLVIYSKEVPESFRPRKWLKLLAISGMIFLVLFAGVFIYMNFQ